MRPNVALLAPFLSAALLAGCATMPGKPDNLGGAWSGPHAALLFQGGLGEAQFDCASGTIDDPVFPGADGSFSAKGTYRAGAPGPVKVGQFFKSQAAIYSGSVQSAGKNAGKSGPKAMTLNVTLEDETRLGPFTLTEGAPPQLTRCL
jgi:hypothetical protein